MSENYLPRIISGNYEWELSVGIMSGNYDLVYNITWKS